MTPQPDHLPRRLWWVLAALSAAWGFNWTAMKVALAEVGPWTFRSLCLGLGAAVLFVALRAGGQPLGVPRRAWGRLAVLGLLNISCWNMLIAYGVAQIPSGRAAIIAYSMPVFAIPLSVWLLKERITAARLAGVLIGLCGLALLLIDSMVAVGESPVGALIVLAAAIAWAVGTVLQKRLPAGMPLGAYTAWLLLLGGVPIVAGMFAFEDPTHLARISLPAAAAVAYNVVVAFAFAHWAWIKIATSVPVAVFSVSMMLIPVIGVLSGILFLGERPGWVEFAALACVLIALATVLRPQAR